MQIGRWGLPTSAIQRITVHRLKESARTLHNYVNDLRCLGAEIEFCPPRCTYYYVQPFRPFGRTEEEDRTPPIFLMPLGEVQLQPQRVF